MKKVIFYTLGLILVLSQACQKYETEDVILDKFGIYEIVDEEAGNELSTIPANTTVRIQILTNADIAVVWTGDYSYRPWGTSDSLLNSHSYEHYGQVGAEGLSTGAIGDNKGWFRDYAWDAGNYTITIVLTNHGTAGPEYKQIKQDYQITVQ